MTAAPQVSTGSAEPTLEWFPDAPKQCPCCGGDFVAHNDEDENEYEAWEYECGLCLGRGKHLPFTAFEDCDNATSAALEKYNQALLAQRIEHEPSKLGVEGSNPSERTSGVAQRTGDCGARDTAKHLQEQLDLSALESQRLLKGLATINNYLCENPPRIGDATFDCEALLASVEPWPDAPAQPTQGGDKGEAVAWRYKCEDGSEVLMLKRLTDEQKRRGYYTGEDGEDEVDGDEAIVGPFHWAEETPLYAAPQPASNAYAPTMPQDVLSKVHHLASVCCDEDVLGWFDANPTALAVPSTDREYDPNVAPCDDAEFGMKP